MQLSAHARQRWGERFPDLRPADEWASARLCGRKAKAKIKAACPAHAHLMNGFNGFYYMLSRGGVVFVVTPPETVVTVFPYRREVG